MPPYGRTRALLNPDLLQQLRLLFGKAPNVHARLGLGAAVVLSDVQKALAGYPVPEHVAKLLTLRWHQWRRAFLADPETAPVQRERASRLAGDYFHPEARDPVRETLLPGFTRFTLPPDAGRYL